ncbi:hypothetical protein KAR91_19230, partial [Candidatus Pacearchaeota archaeon]|nr:hypothetical protein [Candidatus Pacearchaeota archaeon]
MGSQMPDCYPKLWYSIFQDKWFVKQSALRRGIFLQLIIWAKGNGDTGAVIFHGWGAVGSAFNCDGRKSARKILGNFH